MKNTGQQTWATLNKRNVLNVDIFSTLFFKGVVRPDMC